ncbi:MAG: aminoglycoside phosphotransferase family protein [Mycobacterium sp.]
MIQSAHPEHKPVVPLPLPTGPGDLTAAWLGSVLGTDVGSICVEAVGTGQTGSTYRITPVYSRPSGLPRTLIMKLPSQDRDVRDRVALGYRAEHAFYTRAASTVRAPVPAVYYCETSSDGSEFALLMADLSPATQGDQIRGCTPAEAQLAVEALAGLHGPRWCDPAWLTFDGVTMPKADLDIARGMGQLAHSALDATLAGLGDRISIQDRSTLIESAHLVEQWLGINPDRFCLLHGDYRLDNLLFHPERAAVTVVDWQTITVGLPARDLAYFLGTSMDADLRTQTESELVDAYHRRLRDIGVRDYTAAQCWSDYRIGMLQVPLLTTFGYAFAATTDRGDAMVLTMLARGCRAIRDLGTNELIRELT